MADNLWNDEQEKPLQHLRVTDLTIMLPAPYLTRLLAQYGADVVKVEALPFGDPLRLIERSSAHEFLNQGKRSIALDVKKTTGVEIVKRLTGEADVFVENFREGVMDSLGLGYAELSEENPDLIYLSLRGMSGKSSKRASHDLNFIAASGCGEWFLESGVPNYSTHWGDMIGGMMVPALKLLMHLANPDRRGMHIISYMDASFRSVYAVRAYESCTAQNLPEGQRREFGLQAMLRGVTPHSRYYRCRDGAWISLNAVQQKHWDHFCEAVSKPEWKKRREDVSLCGDLEKFFHEAPASHFDRLAEEKDICLQRVVPWSEHLSFTDAKSQLMDDPLTWAGFQANPKLSPAPEVGRDTFSILHSLGYSNKEIADLIQSKVASQPEKR